MNVRFSGGRQHEIEISARQEDHAWWCEDQHHELGGAGTADL